MFKILDKFLNSITMYRLMLYGLLLEAGYAIILALFGRIPSSPVHMVTALAILLVCSYGTNWVFGKLTRAAVNAESVYITALLLFFVLDPNTSSLNNIVMLAFGAILAQASKYFFAIGRRHVFNPVAMSAVILDLLGISIVSWWVATPWLLPVVLVFGLMVVRKVRRFEEVGAFTVAAIVVALIQHVPFTMLFLSWPLVFFGTMMLTEPRTAPSMKRDQILYGAGIGVLFMSMLSIGSIFMTPEFALLIGNIFAFLVSSRQVLRLTYKSMTCETEQVCDFAFVPDHPLRFRAGQYLEWTLPLQKTDSRGNRRYFTIASAPSDPEIHLGVRVDRAHASQFKQQLLEMKPGDQLVASHLAGEFVLPKDSKKKLVFVAGGIGITPFRSMIRELASQHEKRDIKLFYCANTEKDFAYKAEFDQVCNEIGMCSICMVAKPGPGFMGKSGFITKEIIESEVPDYKERIFYFSGPPMMVQNYVKMVRSMGVPKKQIKTDYFPGF